MAFAHPVVESCSFHLEWKEVSESPVLAGKKQDNYISLSYSAYSCSVCANVLKSVEHLLIPQGLLENLHPLLRAKILRFEGNLFYVKGLTASVTVWYIKDKVFPIHAKKAQLYRFLTSTLPWCPFSMRLGGSQNRSGNFRQHKNAICAELFSTFFFFFFFPPCGATSQRGPGRLICEVTRSHTTRHTHIPATAPSKVAEAATYTTQTQETNIHIINGIRTRNLSSQADSDLHLRLHGHQYSLLSLTVCVKFTRRLKQCPCL
jgi:hypothetical protein